jgi:serine/threonine protein kinase
MALLPGTRLGPYEIVGPLGSGGMSVVYRARDPHLARDVAVKLVAAEGATSPARLGRFETEARAVAQLSHPNVVTVFDVGTHEGQPYLVLELLEGATLRAVLRSGAPVLAKSVAWARDAARGLGAAHARGIVHRDLKPENLFLTKDGRVKVLDFGLAKLREPFVSSTADRDSPSPKQDTAPGLLLGTIGYMAPEQVKGRPLGPRADVFALGAVLYELVAGGPAFAGGTPAEVLASILRDEPPPLAPSGRGVPAGLEAVVRRCLAKDPGDRYPTAREAAETLDAVLTALGSRGTTPHRPRETRASSTRSTPVPADRPT